MTLRRPTALLLLAVLPLALGGCAPAAVGVVDTNRVLTESARALSYQRQLDEQEKAMAADLRLLTGRLPPADLEARRNQYLKELEALKAELERRLNEEVRAVIAQVVRERRLRYGVLVKGPIIHAQPGRIVDITDEVIERLR